MRIRVTDVRTIGISLMTAFLFSFCTGGAVDTGEPNPWALPPPPPKSVYSGPLFVLSHDYPTTPVTPPDPAPWREAIGGGYINTDNAAAYVQALKDYIAEDMKILLFDYENWDPGAAGWYNIPWLTSLGTTNQPGILREAIRGSYVGSTFAPAMFPKSGLQDSMTTHVVVYYDAVSAWSLQQVWGTSGMDPVPGLDAGGAQFPDGGIIVKAAFSTADGNTWSPLEGASRAQLWALPGAQSTGDPTLLSVSLFQFDIIVKDTVSAPKTGWVFSTLVYDKSVDSDDPWDRMVALGAMWGNDPDVNSPEDCDYLVPGSCPPLSETWINEATPVYARETLGWGGRLSGPNDGAVDIAAYIQTPDGPKPYQGRYAMSSCMSCHGPAEYKQQSFLLPVPADCQGDNCVPTIKDGSLVYYQAGSPEFMEWFQSRPGDEPQNAGQIALDYDMNFSFKALPQWYTATGQTGKLNFIEEFNDYRGRKIQASPVTTQK